MPVLNIPQSESNPYCYLTQSEEWVQFEYRHQRGSMFDLLDRVRRYTVYNDVRLELEILWMHTLVENCAQLKAWRYLLRVGEFDGTS